MPQTEGPSIISIKSYGTQNGEGILSVLDKQELPFEVQRLFWIHDVEKQVSRGKHAHKTLRQLVVAIQGSVKFKLENQQGQTWQYNLNNPGMVLYMPELIWHEMEFQPGSILLCLGSKGYDADDYLRDYDQFKNYRPA